MSLSEDYREQFGWRAWAQALDASPITAGQHVLDLGCGVGDVARLLEARGCRVTGVDANPELLATARAQAGPNSRFIAADLRNLELDGPFDGIWSSFAAAYFPADFAQQLTRWLGLLAPGGWICLVEVDDFFAHSPLHPETEAQLATYVDQALALKRYDFNMGRRLAGHLAACGLQVSQLDLPDREISFSGPAEAAVLAAWQRRFERLGGLRNQLGEQFEGMQTDFLAGLTSPAHRSQARVVLALGLPSPG